jgi:hypothetical protein
MIIDQPMKIQLIPNMGQEWETIVDEQYQISPKQQPNSGKKWRTWDTHR